METKQEELQTVQSVIDGIRADDVVEGYISIDFGFVRTKFLEIPRTDFNKAAIEIIEGRNEVNLSQGFGWDRNHEPVRGSFEIKPTTDPAVLIDGINRLRKAYAELMRVVEVSERQMREQILSILDE